LILKLDKGTLSVGADADITMIDLNEDWTVNASQFKSKSKNTPFDGWKLRGKAVWTIVGGKI
jgi:dihydroorotase